MSKGGSKLVTGLISFLLGFIFAILVEIGAIFGVYWFVMNNDINTVMAAIGIDNEGDRYINTDKENGGVSNLKELLSGVKGLVFENGELAIVGKSFDDISNLIPATQMLLNTFYGIADEYIEIDHDEFESNPLMNLAQVLSESILNIKTGALLEKANIEDRLSDEAKPFIKAFLAGAECDYATVVYADGRESTLRLPVMYDYYRYDETSGFYYNCTDNASAFPANLNGREDVLLTPSGDNRYALYYVPCKVTADGIEEAEYGYKDADENTHKFKAVEYGEDTDFIAVEYDDGNFVIDYDAVYDALNAESTGASYRLEGYSYYEQYARNYYYIDKYKDTDTQVLKTYSGKNYFRDNSGKMIQLAALRLIDIIYDPTAPLEFLTVGELLGLSDNQSGLLGAIKDTPLNRLEERINELTVGDIVKDEELEKSSMLRQLKHTKVTELATAIDKLFIQRVYAEEVYGVGKDSDPTLADVNDFHADWLYYKKVDDTFVLANTQDEPPADDTAYDDALGHITEAEFEAGEYYTYGGAQGMWRLVLYKNKVEKAYTMNNFNNMVAACADNVYKATLYDLQEAGVIDKSKEDLKKSFNGKELGEMTLEELINAVLAL